MLKGLTHVLHVFCAVCRRRQLRMRTHRAHAEISERFNSFSFHGHCVLIFIDQQDAKNAS